MTAPLYDPIDPTFADRCHDIFREMRDHHPLYRDPDERFFALSRFDDVRNACLEWETFSSWGKQAPNVRPTMNSYDPPEHTALRALIARGFTPRRVAEMEGRIREIARELIAEIVERGEGDAIHDFAAILPSVVMGRLIGLSDERIVMCRHLTDEFMHQTTPQGANEPAVRSYAIFGELLAERRAEPRDDLMSALLAAEVDGERLTQDQLESFGWLLLVGGNDTTTNLIGNGLELFARHPDQRRLVLDDPGLLVDAADEVLRYATPTHTLPRIAVQEANLDHGTIPAGSRVLLVWAAANLDEREFPDPERFDVRRRAPRHLALGHGVHYCMGASLAKLEARIAWEEWLAAMPDYELSAQPRHFTSPTFYGWESLRVSAGEGASVR